MSIDVWEMSQNTKYKVANITKDNHKTANDIYVQCNMKWLLNIKAMSVSLNYCHGNRATQAEIIRSVPFTFKIVSFM